MSSKYIHLPKLITILGPTASGKSSLGIKLAQEFDGEIVSADSRQVYRGLDIGTGKVTPEEQKLVPHHLLDIVDPMANFSVAHFQELAFKAIDDIVKRDKPARNASRSDAGGLPFLVGGTALYIYAVVDNYDLSDVDANPARRKELEKKSIEELHVILSEASRRRAESKDLVDKTLGFFANAQNDALNPSDLQNPRRLIRAIEKLEAGATLKPNKKPPRYDTLLLGIDIPRDELYKKIDQRVDERVKLGMIEEVERLRQHGVSDKWLISLGLEYRYITKYLQNKCQPEAGQPLAEQRDEMLARLKTAIHAFARRQMTWWKRDQRIIWIKNFDEAKERLADFLK